MLYYRHIIAHDVTDKGQTVLTVWLTGVCS